MDPERAKRRQSLKIIISETIMVIAVVLMVAILALLVSGYWVNSDFKVERQGLLQVSSIPTGADVYIDGDSSWLQRTNTSKVLSSGEHTITLTKDGYSSWSRTINISEGLLYRLHYPRLFLNDRTPENMFSINATVATFSPDHNLLLMTNNTTTWQLINLDNDSPQPQNLDVSNIFSNADTAGGTAIGVFNGEILEAKWDSNNSHILFKIKNSDSTEWVLLDVKNPDKSINITKEFVIDFSVLQILDNSSSNLLAIQDGNLRKIDMSNKSISAILVENIISFDHYDNNEIIFSALDKSTVTENYYIGTINLNNKVTKLASTATPTRVLISKFYDDKYITVLEDNMVTLYKKNDFSPIKSFELSFIPDNTKIGHDGDFVNMSLSDQIATLDMEAMDLTEWKIETPNFGWLDNNMIYVISEGQLIVYDFNGLNRRILSSSVSSNLPVTITSDKWLYYFSNGYLVRELIAR